ncbi:DNA/RNA polymerases superfamily protein [Gossypium australe]|uniref:DNA/RNA polymerases superfamily protein n=1 Tax=Gossypium australe TaxID=47621 RepID=A0A5B6VA45_9ROSI|nr:DNA/RNA polymerases superfamily protein [Gossypium australe]
MFISKSLASDRQNSYADLKQKETKYAVGEKVFLKVSLWKKVLCFGCKGKLSPRFIEPYKIIERVGSVAYRLALSSKLQKIHDVFHASMSERYRSYPSHITLMETIEVQPDLSYEEESIKILAQEVKELGSKCVALEKVRWHIHNMEEATWESKEVMRSQ